MTNRIILWAQSSMPVRKGRTAFDCAVRCEEYTWLVPISRPTARWRVGGWYIWLPRYPWLLGMGWASLFSMASRLKLRRTRPDLYDDRLMDQKSSQSIF
jgi:hypothetical protein